MKLKILLTITALVTLNSCCWTDHSETIKKVAEPMIKQLDTFYKKNKRHPNKEERNEMLLASGCSKVENKECSFGWKTLVISRTEIVEPNTYWITLNYDNTYCLFGVYEKGDLVNLSCENRPCLHISQ